MLLKTVQAAALAGITQRTAQLWDELGFVSPARAIRGEQTVRLYDEQNVLRLMVLADLQKRGMGRRKLLPTAAASLPPDLKRANYLIFDGQVFRECEEALLAITWISDMAAPAWLVEMAPKQKRAAEAAASSRIVLHSPVRAAARVTAIVIGSPNSLRRETECRQV